MDADRRIDSKAPLRAFKDRPDEFGAAEIVLTGGEEQALGLPFPRAADDPESVYLADIVQNLFGTCFSGTLPQRAVEHPS